MSYYDCLTREGNERKNVDVIVLTSRAEVWGERGEASAGERTHEYSTASVAML